MTLMETAQLRAKSGYLFAHHEYVDQLLKTVKTPSYTEWKRSLLEKE